MVLDHQKDYGSQREAIVGIGAKVSSSSRTDFVLDALEQALHARRPMQGGWIDHSDRGVQYVSIRYTQRLAEAGIEPSVGSVGDSWDNAPAETSNGLHKAEVIHRRSWKTMQEVELATLDCVDWFNHKRLLERSGISRQRRPKRPMIGNRSRCRRRRDSHKMVYRGPGGDSIPGHQEPIMPGKIPINTSSNNGQTPDQRHSIGPGPALRIPRRGSKEG